MNTNILDKVIEKAGGVPALARKLGIKDQAVRQWIENGYIPTQRHYEIHQKFKVSLTELAKSAALKRTRTSAN
jgi:DNA-binding transcriptional regulator YdaS (Cro superfamily)